MGALNLPPPECTWQWVFMYVHRQIHRHVRSKYPRFIILGEPPRVEQEKLLAQTFGCVRFVYNQILRWRTDEYYKNGNSVNYNAASKQLTELKKNPEFQWLNDVSSVPIQQSLRHQQTAFKNFCTRRA